MEKNVSYEVSDKNIQIKSFNHKENKNELKKILSLVRKEDAKVYHLVTKTGDILLKCSGAHKIWDNTSKQYFPVMDIESGTALNSASENVEFFVKETGDVVPIVDMEVEGNSNYFTNGILSHNTTTGGNALKYYDSIRLRTSQFGKVEEGSGAVKERTGINVRVECVKNKTAPPFKKAEGVIMFGTGFDNEAAYINLLISSGIITKKGAGWFYYGEEKIIQGLNNLKEWLKSNPDRYIEMKSKLKDVSTSFVPTKEMEEEMVEEVFEEVESDGTTEVGEV